MSHDHHDDRSDQSSDSGPGGDPPDAATPGPRRTRADSVEAGWLRPHANPLGRPRVTTVVLLLAWIALLILYLQVRPGG
ncbi:hypothetical protein [Nocardia nova]|uniref:hypothetical protein n=1 Tax=Nocardia nova TaxID=37330 RepID=UPI000CEA39B3|nr:hypothetical protein [Nocardia nova]PPJ24157.1 hypothetical protein C5E41_22935 [Nocardia nova]